VVCHSRAQQGDTVAGASTHHRKGRLDRGYSYLTVYQILAPCAVPKQLNDLATSGRIPATIGEMAQHLRYLRNIGVHKTYETVTEEDIPVLLEVLEAILEYLYVFPTTMKALQLRLQTKGGV